MDVYVYDRNLDLIGIVDGYKSLIWANRYWENGDCEVYCPATELNLAMLRKNNYLAIQGSDMMCKIKKIQLDTDAENGNYIVVTGVDVKSYLDQRVIWNVLSADGNAEAFVRQMVDTALGNTTADRCLLKPNGNRLFYLDTAAGFTEALTEQVSYKNIGEKTREICLKYGWGYKVIYNNGALYFSVYKGENRADFVIFSTAYENLISATYVEDETNLGNVAIVAGEGQGTARERAVCGEYTGEDRYEVYVDAKDISKTISYGDLIELFPTGTVSNKHYTVTNLDVQIIDDVQLASLQAEYPNGQIVTIDGVNYYRIPSAVVADLESNNPDESDEVILRDVIYEVYLRTRGYEKLAEYGAITSFDGTIEPNSTFVYGRDYSLGDIVTVENDFGIRLQARIVEIVEVWDDNGYSVQPKFEYISEV